jgi:2-keto-4-pentenoate hydratase/2-oxohepta-3-ene-1,7-dioic acid hydratase in catechol pathway
VRVGNVHGRSVIVANGLAHDIATVSGGAFGPDPTAVLDNWDAFVAWAADADLGEGRQVDAADFGPPVTRPRQVFAVALNYRPHAAEAGYQAPEQPLIFTKYPSCLTGPNGVIDLPDGHVDWEIELVAVVARDAYRVPVEKGWDALAGLTIGQDLSERVLQMTGKPAQFSLAKSFPGFGPIGPTLVTADELPDRDSLLMTGSVGDLQVQQVNTAEMIFSVPDLVARITAVCPVYAGDLIFTGTPGGVGNRMTPQRFLGPDDELISTIEHLGEMRHHFRVADPSK